jgi:hypothetical protein
VVPRDHAAAAAWISHESWRTEPGVAPGKRNAGVDKARVDAAVFTQYLDHWDLPLQPSTDAPVLLPVHYRDLASSKRVGLPPGHPWVAELPDW